MARCIENNTIEIVPYECPPLKNITCSNGNKPVLVYDEHYCCQHYVCDCKSFCGYKKYIIIIVFLLFHKYLYLFYIFFVSFQAYVKAGEILTTSHLMDYITVIKETVLMS